MTGGAGKGAGERDLIVGLMSGTSLDGISAALVGFDDADACTLHAFVSRP